MKIQAICDGEASAMSIWMQGIAKYSKHDIEVRQWAPRDDPELDLLYFHYGSFVQGNYPFLEDHPRVACGLNMAGPKDFVCVTGWLRENPDKIKSIKGVITLGTFFNKLFKDIFKDIPTYICEVGVDISLFPRRPPPKHFRIGCGENNNYPLNDSYLKQFLSYGYPVSTAGNGKGTEMSFERMSEFYENISVLIDYTLNPRPGGLMFLEAASTGRPIIAMKSGITADWFPVEFLMENINDVIRILLRLNNDKGYYQHASDLWRRVAESRDYSIVAQEYDLAFDSMIVK